MKNLKLKALTVAGLTIGAAAPAFATDSPVTTAINAAITSGQSNVTLVVTGLITLAALAFGVTMVVGFLRR